MINYDWMLSIPSIALIFVIALIQTLIFRQQLLYEKSFVEEEANFYDETLQSLNNIAQIRTSGNEKSIINRWSKLIFFTSLRFNVNVLSGYTIIANFLNNFGLSLIYAFLIYRLLTQVISTNLGCKHPHLLFFRAPFRVFQQSLPS